MTKTEIEEIRARLESIRPWPWAEDDCNVFVRELAYDRFDRVNRKLDGERVSTKMDPREQVCKVDQQRPGSDEVATFIAKAPETIAALLEEVGRLRGLVRRVSLMQCEGFPVCDKSIGAAGRCVSCHARAILEEGERDAEDGD